MEIKKTAYNAPVQTMSCAVAMLMKDKFDALEAAQFEARVAEELLFMDEHDVPCSGWKKQCCPYPEAFKKDGWKCYEPCLVRQARLRVEEDFNEIQLTR